MAPGRLLLLDSATLYYRAFHALPTSLTGPDGLPNNAVRGFCDALPALVAAAGATHLACAWDVDWRPAWRVSLWPGYKRNRVQPAEGDAAGPQDETADELAPQVEVLADVLDAAGLARVGAAQFEADDVIATLALRWPGEVVIVTSDRDLLQCVSDDGRVRLLSMARGLAHLQWFDAAAVQERYGVAPHRYAEFATLRGDASDGMPGVPGIGEKTAAALVSRWPSLPDLLVAAQEPQSDLKPRVRKALVDAANVIPAWAEVTRARTDVEVVRLGVSDAAAADSGLPVDPLTAAPTSDAATTHATLTDATLTDAGAVEHHTALPATARPELEHVLAEAGVARSLVKWRPTLLS